ncbi:hypothetical protein DIPPA_10054 [Diplonema papillatum]|nr:hypothetical protein DIPPA_10054 [Diplonema papillatum]KAJ9448870.1 hypothetical protein DIPPA_10054 [Diplonema papillatum]
MWDFPYYGVIIPYIPLCIVYTGWAIDCKWPVRATLKTLPVAVLAVWTGLVAWDRSAVVVGDVDGTGFLFWSLVCSALGDAFLALPKCAPLGILAFSVGQILFSACFLQIQPSPEHGWQNWLIPLLVLLLLETYLFVWILLDSRRVADEVLHRFANFYALFGVVFSYFILLTVAVSLSLGLLADGSGEAFLVVAGMLLFYVSDHLIVLGGYLMFTRTKPKEPAEPAAPPGSGNERFWRRAIIVTYYVAQLFITCGVVWH